MTPWEGHGEWGPLSLRTSSYYVAELGWESRERGQKLQLARQMQTTQALESYGARFKSRLPQPGPVCSHVSAQSPHQ